MQIGFYSIGSVLAILTYLAAKRGLLNTVNTEYQKRVMDRLEKLSQDLYSEFDMSSDTHWSKMQIVRDAIEEINETFELNREEILSSHTYDFGIPYTDDVGRLRALLDPIVSDPFIPEKIRVVVVDLLDSRIDVMDSIYSDEFEKYSANLAKGKHKPFTDVDDVNKIHNRVIDKRNLRGCGITQIEQEVHKIRGIIRNYFEAFNPHRRWWRR